MNFGKTEIKISNKYKSVLIIGATILCITVTAALTFILKVEATNTLLLCPIILTGIWYSNKTLLISLILGFIQLMSDYWVNQNFTISSLLNTLSFILVAVLFDLLIKTKNEKQKEISKDKNRYKLIFDNAAEAFFVIQDNKFTIYNEKLIKLSGYTKQELDEMNPFETMIYPDDKTRMLKEHIGKENGETYENTFRITKKDGSTIWVKANVVYFVLDDKPALMSSIVDITNKKHEADMVKINERNYAAILSQMQSGFLHCQLIKDEHGVVNDCIMKKTNKSFREIMELEDDVDVEGQFFREVFPELKDLFDKLKGITNGEPKIQSEYYLKSLHKYIEYYAFPLNKNEFVVFVNNITKEKKMEKKFQYLDTHDALTGVYNERYLNSILPSYNNIQNGTTSIIVAQLNGIKLANNAFKNLSWEEFVLNFSKILKEECREVDIITRDGRDKFVIILPLADRETAEKIVKNIRIRINNEAKKYEIFSAAIGFETKEDIADDILDIYEQAESNMYKDKLLMKNSVRDRNVQAIVNALYKISDIEQEHANNVSLISEKIALAMGVPRYEVEQIKTAALLHDVGNISIDPAILTKEGKYTEEEWEILRRHPEAGYRILSTSGVYKHIAKYVLEHHERWDGTGYPKGLKEEEILLPARIIAVADSFDAMTTEKPYKKAYTFDEAIAELKKNAGKLFDPEVVKIFVNEVASEFKK